MWKPNTSCCSDSSDKFQIIRSECVSDCCVNGFPKAAVFPYISSRLALKQFVFVVTLSVFQLIVWL